MLKLEQVKLEPGQPEELLAGKAAHMLRIPTEDILNLSVLRRAVDARQPAAAGIHPGGAGAW